MVKLTKCLIVIFGVVEGLEALTRHISRHVNVTTPMFRYRSLGSFTIVSFYSIKKLEVIKTELIKFGFEQAFVIGDLEDTEGFQCALPDDYMKFLIEELDGLNDNPIKEIVLDLDGLLELVSKNGWASLTTDQKSALIKFSSQ